MKALDSVLKKCVVCYKDLPVANSWIWTCEDEFCEYRFEEQGGIMIYPEIKARQQQVILDLSLASECAFTGPTSFEPFPTFLLKNKEMRSKRGYLDEIQNAKQKGFTGNIKWTDDNNKNLQRIFEIFGKISSI